MEYSRDALAGPLRELQKVLKLVKDGKFHPDETRSGRWSEDSGEPENKKQHKDQQEVEQEPVNEEQGEEGSTSSDEEASEDEEREEDMCALEVESADPGGMETWINKVQRTVHLSAGDGRHTACGCVLTFPNWTCGKVWPEDHRLCGRSKCFGC